MLGFVSAAGAFWSSRKAKYQADSLRHLAEARRHEKRRELLAKPYHSASEVALLHALNDPRSAALFETTSNGAMRPVFPMDPWTVWKDWQDQLADFSRGGYGWGGQATDKTGRVSGADYPFFWDELSLGLLRSTSRLVVGTNPNAEGLVGGLRRYTFGTGSTVQVRPRGPQYADVARKSQARIDRFRKQNRMAFREREAFTRTSRDGDGILLVGSDAGEAWTRFVWPEQVRRPADESDEEWSFGRRCDPEDAETTLEWAVHPLDAEGDGRPDILPAAAVIQIGHNQDSGVKRSRPDFCLGVSDALEAADELAGAMGKGSTLQAKIAYIRKHASAPADAIRALPPATATHQKMDAFGNVIDAQKFMDGTIVDTKDSEFLPSPYNAGIPAHLEVFQMLNRRAASRWNAPEWLGTSFSQEVNFASSLTAESPFVLTVQEMQSLYADVFRDLYERVLAMDAAAGKLPRDVLECVEVVVTLPSPVVRDKLQEAQRGQAQLATGATSPQILCEEAGNEWERVQADRKAVGLPPVGVQPAQGGPPPPPPPDAAPAALPAQPDDNAPFALDVAAESEEGDEADALALLEAGTFTGVIFGKYFLSGKHVDKATYDAATAAGRTAKGKPGRKHLERAATEKATEYFRKSQAADEAGDKEAASRYRVAGAIYHVAAGAYAKGNKEGGDLAVVHAEARANGKAVEPPPLPKKQAPAPAAGSIDRTNPDLDAAMAAPVAGEPKAEPGLARPNPDLDAALGGTEPPALTRGYAWAAKQADQHAAKVAAHLGLKGHAARSMLNHAIRQAVEKAVASGAGSVVITGKGGKKIRVTVRKKQGVSEAKGAEEFDVEVEPTSMTPGAAYLIEADPADYEPDPADWLAEHGFTGTDRIGRKWVDGKEVKSGEAASSASPAHASLPSDDELAGAKVEPLSGTGAVSEAGGLAKVTTADGKAHFFKAVRPAEAAREAAVSELAAIAGVAAPAGRVASVGGKQGLLTAWVDGKRADQDKDGFAKAVAADPASATRTALFHFLVGAADKSSSNYLVSDGRIVSFDHGEALGRFDADESRVGLDQDHALATMEKAGIGLDAGAVKDVAGAAGRMADHLKAKGMADAAAGVEKRAALLTKLAADSSPTEAKLRALLGDTKESAEPVPALLLEHGFTGTDRLGRKWVDGKEVKGDAQATAAAPTGHAYPVGYTPPKSLSPGVGVGPNPKLSEATRPPLTAPEADAVTAYTDVQVYRALNEALKAGGPLPRPGALARLLGSKNVGGVHDKLQAAFAKTPASDPPMVLRRGVFSRHPEKLGQHFLSNRGKVVTLPGYQSTSAAVVAPGSDPFTEPGGGYKGNVKFTIHAVYGLDVRPYSKFPAEDEVLLNHGGEYHVGRVEKVGNEWHVELFQLPPKSQGATA